MTDVDDRELMARIARRDERAFDLLVERHGPRMLALASRLLGSRADGEDAVQRAFLRCWLHAADYRDEWAPSTWLGRIVTNACVDEMRRRDAGAARDAAWSEARGRRADPDLDVQRAFDAVPREARILLALRHVAGFSHQELARVRGISVNTVKSQLARGRSLMRAAMEGGAPRRTR